MAGNGLAVVHDADDLPAETMLRIARETNQSETTFVQAPTRVGADYLHRHAGTTALAIDQGAQLGRPSRLDTAIEAERVRVAGGCVIVLEGTLSI